MLDIGKLIVLGIVTLLAAIAANYAHDLPYQVNAVEVMVASALTFLFVLRRTDEPRVVHD